MKAGIFSDPCGVSHQVGRGACEKRPPGERNGGDILSVTQLAQSMFIEQSRF